MAEFKIETGSDADRKICDFIQAWNTLEQSLPSGMSFSDFNLPNYQTELTLKNRAEAEGYLEALYERADIQACPATMRRLEAFSCHLASVQMDADEMDLVQNQYEATGVTLQMIDTSTIERSRQNVIDAARDLGYTAENYATKLNEIMLPEGQSISDFGNEILAQYYDTISAIIGMRPEFTPMISAAKIDENWAGRIYGEGRNFRVEINGKYAHLFSKPSLKNTFIHELLGHGMHYATSLNAIERGERPMHTGMPAMIGAEAFLGEGIADNLAHYLDNNDDPHDRLYNLNLLHKRKIMNNVVYLSQHGRVNEAIEYGKSFTSEADHSTIKSYALETHSVANDRVYNAPYGATNHLFSTAQAELSDNAFKAVLKDCYTTYLFPEELNQVFIKHGLARDHSALLNTKAPYETHAPLHNISNTPEI